MVTIPDYTAARTNMVEGQIRPNKVTDPRIVTAFQTLPREQFLPKPLRSIAYVDEDVHLGGGRYLMEPMVLARLIQEVQILATDVVLVVGCATGFTAAVTARLAQTVVGIESETNLAADAVRALEQVGVDNAIIMTGPLDKGWPKQGPYDVIGLEGAVAEVPPALFAQLAEGGRLIGVIHRGSGMGEARVFVKVAGGISGRALFDAAIHPLPGFAEKLGFVF